MIRKIIQNKKTNIINRERASSAALSKKITDNNNYNFINNKNLSLNYNYEYTHNVPKRYNIPKSQIFHTSNSNYNININNNSKNNKSYRLSNKSAGSINYRCDLLNDNCSPIRKRNTYNNKHNKNCAQINTLIESENNLNFNCSNIPTKKISD
jgi:hypothetical protein